MSEDFLDAMARAARARVDAARAAEPEASLFRRAFAMPDPPRLTLSPLGFDLIAEVNCARRPSASSGGAAKTWARA
jgi:hypothetical protein